MVNLLNISRVAFSIGGVEIYWYGIIMCLAIFVAIFVATLLCKKKKYKEDLPINIALIIVPFGILSARLFSCLFDDSLSILDFFNFRTGGMSIIGAIIGGGVALLIYCLIKKVKNPLIYFDVLCSVLILAQAIGRWGNFFNSEVYGLEVAADSFFARFPFAVEIDGKFYQALFFYESMANLVVFVILAIVFLKTKRPGYTTALYLFCYGSVRSFLELLRQEEYILRLGNIPVSLTFSIIMAASGALLYFILRVIGLKDKENGKKIK